MLVSAVGFHCVIHGTPPLDADCDLGRNNTQAHTMRPPDEEGSKHFLNVGQFLSHCTAQPPRRQSS